VGVDLVSYSDAAAMGRNTLNFLRQAMNVLDDGCFSAVITMIKENGNDGLEWYSH